jgi:hypothetical protein
MEKYTNILVVISVILLVWILGKRRFSDYMTNRAYLKNKEQLFDYSNAKMKHEYKVGGSLETASSKFDNRMKLKQQKAFKSFSQEKAMREQRMQNSKKK